MFVNDDFSGGLVTSRPAALLRQGELSAAVDVIYRSDSDLLWPGYARKSHVASVDPTGLVIAKFDSGVSFLVFQQSTNILRARELASGASSADVSSYTLGSTLAGIGFRNRYVMLNGSNANKLLYHTGTSSTAPVWLQHGLEKVTQKPGLAMTTGTWPLGDAGVGKYYEYWYTEVVTLADGTELESDTDPTAVETTPVAITATTDAVNITIPLAGSGGLANSAASKVRIYRSTGKTYFPEKQFPVGTLVAELLVSGATGTSISTVDGNTGTTSYVFPGTVAAGSWTNCTTTSLGTDDTNRASITVGASVSQTFTATNFSFSGVQDFVAGVELNMRCDYSVVSSGGLFAEISIDGGSTWSSRRSCAALVAENYRTIGGPADRWGLGVTANGMSTTNFVVRITAVGPISGSATARVNYIKVRVFYNGSSGSSSTAFPAVVLEADGVLASVGSHGKPPTASTGDVFQDRLVLNDTAHPSYVWWSLAGEPHYFPTIYFNDFETDDNDQVKCIRSLGSRCAIGLLGQLWRANYLPTAEDASYDRGRAFEMVDPSHGIVGPRAACTFVGADGRTTLAFVALDGLYGSDLFSTWELCPDLKWRDLLTPHSQLSNAVLVNNPRNSELLLYIPGGTDSSLMAKRIPLSYAPRHMKGNTLKAGGVTTVGTPGSEGFSGADCAPNLDTGYAWSVYEAVKDNGASGIGNTIWRVVDCGTASSTAPAPSWSTRPIYAAGIGNKWYADELQVFRAGTPSTALTVTPTVYLGNVDGIHAMSAITFDTGSTEDFYTVPMRASGAAIQLAFVPTGDTTTSAYGPLSIRSEEWGQEK